MIEIVSFYEIIIEEIEEVKEESSNQLPRHNGDEQLIYSLSLPPKERANSQFDEMATKKKSKKKPFPVSGLEDLPPRIQPLQLLHPIQTSTRTKLLSVDEPINKLVASCQLPNPNPR